MRVFLAGATGVIGRRLVPQLLAAGHHVTGMVRSPQRAQAVRTLGAEPAIADALDAEAVRGAVAQARPEAVIHELTALPRRIKPRQIERPNSGFGVDLVAARPQRRVESIGCGQRQLENRPIAV